MRPTPTGYNLLVMRFCASSSVPECRDRLLAINGRRRCSYCHEPKTSRGYINESFVLLPVHLICFASMFTRAMEGPRGQRTQGMQRKSRPTHPAQTAQTAQTAQRTRRAPYPVSRPGAYRVVPDVPDVPGDAFDHGNEEQQYPDVGPFGDDIAFAGDAETNQIPSGLPEKLSELGQAIKNVEAGQHQASKQLGKLEAQQRQLMLLVSALREKLDGAPDQLASLIEQYLDNPEEQFQPANQTIDPMNLQSR
ncbi:uncharacterized protein F5Z01DRAFT_493743 [Emericellopsis atlantica]|uniref:Uncharacterized protein n=1 Tax=Emericellopsis atlantica TaxID=2614577 RepID=A0A9P7ZCQ5_9HYPO|nr:uncharacterized protein F5Z01DRAFT_493743 [Emericellopsis atlantica]KAG9249565.1 hypothetical protein F5Z01DRAFT_493743 [Emericellopsis atlantica]